MSAYLRPWLVAFVALFPATARNQPAVTDWAPIVIVLDDRHAEWCPDCAWLPNLGVHPVATKGE